MEYPELVFDGMVIAGYTIGAKTGISFICAANMNICLNSLKMYLMKMRDDNLLGNDILGKERIRF